MAHEIQSFNREGLFMDLELGNISTTEFYKTIQQKASLPVALEQIADYWNLILLEISDEKLEGLAIEAARKALEDASVDPADLDFIICSNVVNEYVTPQLSCIIQGAIGAACPCMDINCACAGFIHALEIAESFHKAGRVNNVLVVCAEESAHGRSARGDRRALPRSGCGHALSDLARRDGLR